MVLQLLKRLFGKSDPFIDFTSNAERLQAILSKMEYDVQTKNWKALQDKGNAALRIIGTVTGKNPQCLITLWTKQNSKIHSLPESGKKHTLLARQELLKKSLRVVLAEVAGIVETGGVSPQRGKQHPAGMMLKKKLLEAEKTLATVRALVRQQMQSIQEAKQIKSKISKN